MVPAISCGSSGDKTISGGERSRLLLAKMFTKPSNLLVTVDGRVKIADFGIAKLTGEDGKEQLTLTQRGFVLGSPHYMAPEQLESPGDVDQRADIYSLGVEIGRAHV